MKNILFLGCGKMGSIVMNNLLDEKVAKASQIKVITRSKEPKLAKNYKADLVFIAIKPQGSEEILREFAKRELFHSKTIFVSILAGKKIAFFQKIFGKEAKVVRTMTNLPIEDAQGILTYVCNKNITATEEKKLAKIFSHFGKEFKLKNEKQFGAATALYGSGPAYIFLLQEILAEISKKYGLDDTSLVNQLLLGSSVMSCNSDLDFASLRKTVTSKAGTTAAALDVFQKNSALKKLVEKAIDAAIKRSEELAK